MVEEMDAVFDARNCSDLTKIAGTILEKLEKNVRNGSRE